MTRIGFAYNQKPETPALVAGADAADSSSHGDDEPPSIRRDGTSRFDAATGSTSTPGGAGVAAAVGVSSLPGAAPDDEFAEWDSPATIDAVAAALSALGEVVRLEATPDFPERLRAERGRGLDIVFNIAEGLRGVNREAHVPAICEFYGVPYSGSDPFTLSLCLDKARTKEVLAFRGIPTAPFALVHDIEELAAVLHRLRGERRGTSGRTGDTRDVATSTT